MSRAKHKTDQNGPFHLDKWFLDIVTPDGQAMIFYAAKLRWHHFTVPYTSWLHYEPGNGVSQQSRFRTISMPEIDGSAIHWKDDSFGVEGKWQAKANPLHTYVIQTEEGYLDWRCHQPLSKVQLNINGTLIEGKGYAEQLILTLSPWKIPMDELRWGRFGSDDQHMVWIELRTDSKKQWLWYNGEAVPNCLIEDDHIYLPEQEIRLDLDRSATLEAEKKIQSVVKKLVRFLPDFQKEVPLGMLLADETKWLSKGKIHHPQKGVETGIAIHELVRFNT